MQLRAGERFIPTRRVESLRKVPWNNETEARVKEYGNAWEDRVPTGPCRYSTPQDRCFPKIIGPVTAGTTPLTEPYS